MENKGFFSLSRFSVPRFTVRRLCGAAMLLAITVVLAMFFTFRVGNTVKIPFKFISVYLSAAVFGPWIGGFVGAAGDIINAFMSPVGAWLPQLSLCEFLCGADLAAADAAARILAEAKRHTLCRDDMTAAVIHIKKK